MAATPVRTPMPSRPNTCGEQRPRPRAPRAGSSRPVASTTVTLAPKRAKTWASSDPIAPPPRTISDSGTCSVSMASRLVQNGVPGQARDRRHGRRGAGADHDPAPRRAARSSPSRPEPVTGRDDRAVPAEQQAALAGEPVGGGRVVPVVGGLVPDPLRATGAQSGCTVDAPAIPGIRWPSASRSAARIIILDGTQPQYGHSPPTSLASTPATRRPASASWPAAYSPPGPSADDDDVHLVITFRHVPSRRIASPCQGIQGGMPAAASALMLKCPGILTDTDGAV